MGAAAIIIVKAKVLAGLLLRGPVVRPRLGVYQLVLVLVFLQKKGKKKRELNASLYENTMEAPVICMESKANQVHEARRAAVESE